MMRRDLNCPFVSFIISWCQWISFTITSSYKNLGSLVSNAKQARLVDWDMIVDRYCSTKANSHWKKPAHIIESVSEKMRIGNLAN